MLLFLIIISITATITTFVRGRGVVFFGLLEILDASGKWCKWNVKFWFFIVWWLIVLRQNIIDISHQPSQWGIGLNIPAPKSSRSFLISQKNFILWINKKTGQLCKALVLPAAVDTLGLLPALSPWRLAFSLSDCCDCHSPAGSPAIDAPRNSGKKEKEQ